MCIRDSLHRLYSCIKPKYPAYCKSICKAHHSVLFRCRRLMNPVYPAVLPSFCRKHTRSHPAEVFLSLIHISTPPPTTPIEEYPNPSNSRTASLPVAVLSLKSVSCSVLSAVTLCVGEQQRKPHFCVLTIISAIHPSAKKLFPEYASCPSGIFNLILPRCVSETGQVHDRL